MANKKGNRLTIRTRDALIHSYIDLLHEIPVNKIRITDICDRAGLSRPTFYKHFQTREELLETYLDTLLDEMFVHFLKLEVSDFSNFKSGVMHFFSLWVSNADIYRLIKETGTEHVLIERLKKHHLQVYQNVVVQVFSVDDPDILDFFISHISYVFYSALDQWMLNGMKQSPEEMGELLSAFYNPYLISVLSEKTKLPDLRDRS